MSMSWPHTKLVIRLGIVRLELVGLVLVTYAAHWFDPVGPTQSAAAI